MRIQIQIHEIFEFVFHLFLHCMLHMLLHLFLLALMMFHVEEHGPRMGTIHAHDFVRIVRVSDRVAAMMSLHGYIDLLVFLLVNLGRIEVR